MAIRFERIRAAREGRPLNIKADGRVRDPDKGGRTANLQVGKGWKKKGGWS